MSWNKKNFFYQEVCDIKLFNITAALFTNNHNLQMQILFVCFVDYNSIIQTAEKLPKGEEQFS